MNFREVYDEHVAHVFRTLHRLGVPERVLPDAVQEVFTVVYRTQDRFEGRSTMRTWLFGIARRVASDYRRSAPARREVLDDELSNVIDGAADIGLWAERSEAFDRAEEALLSLPEEQRLVFALFELEGYTGAEIAEVMNVPVATVHSRLRLARDGVKRKLAALAAGEPPTKEVES